MDAACTNWYFSCMTQSQAIPVFTLYGETDPFPDILHCETYSARAPIHDWRIAPHRHAHMSQLFVILDGEINARIEDDERRLGSGTFLYVPSQKTHEFRFKPDTEGYVLSFPSGVVESLASHAPDMLMRLSKPITATCSDSFLQLSRLLAKTLKQSGPFRIQRALGLAHSVLAAIAEEGQIEHGPAKADALARLQGLDRLIAKHRCDDWSASDYADALSVSTGHLSRLCRQSAGIGATAYIEQSIMEEACRLLAFTQLPVSEIGYRLGFNDPSYFSKRFRIVHHKTPSTYRAQFSG